MSSWVAIWVAFCPFNAVVLFTMSPHKQPQVAAADEAADAAKYIVSF